jgi:hypothetical protein
MTRTRYALYSTTARLRYDHDRQSGLCKQVQGDEESCRTSTAILTAETEQGFQNQVVVGVHPRPDRVLVFLRTLEETQESNAMFADPSDEF